MLKGLKSVDLKIIQNVSLRAKIEKIYGMHKLMGLQLFWSGTPTFCQMGVLNSCFQNPGESSAGNTEYISIRYYSIVLSVL